MRRRGQHAAVAALTLGLLLLGGAATAQTTRGLISVNGGMLFGSQGVEWTQTFDHALFGPEQGRFDTSFPDGDAAAFDISGGVKVWRNLAVGAGVSRFSREDVLDVSAQLPHPFHFDRPRMIGGTDAGLTRNETAVHVLALWIVPAGERVEIAVFGGPSFVTVDQDAAAGISFRQAYPYDTADFSGIQRRTLSGSAVGFNAGADVGFYFTRNIGVGGAIRFTRAAVDLDGTDVDAGGLLTTAGLRVRF